MIEQDHCRNVPYLFTREKHSGSLGDVTSYLLSPSKPRNKAAPQKKSPDDL